MIFDPAPTQGAGVENLLCTGDSNLSFTLLPLKGWRRTFFEAAPTQGVGVGYLLCLGNVIVSSLCSPKVGVGHLLTPPRSRELGSDTWFVCWRC